MPGSTIDGIDHHPAVHVALEDEEAYAAWAGRFLVEKLHGALAERTSLRLATIHPVDRWPAARH